MVAGFICSIAYILLTKTLYPLWLNGFSVNGVQEAAGSNPVTRTKSVFRKEYGLLLLYGTGGFLVPERYGIRQEHMGLKRGSG